MRSTKVGRPKAHSNEGMLATFTKTNKLQYSRINTILMSLLQELKDGIKRYQGHSQLDTFASRDPDWKGCFVLVDLAFMLTKGAI
jgi:hypothetical protein